MTKAELKLLKEYLKKFEAAKKIHQAMEKRQHDELSETAVSCVSCSVSFTEGYHYGKADSYDEVISILRKFGK